ncbi:MAG: alkaline phosphatase PhoX, partial [Cyanobacteriota bacterium]|nr:alkaline phosphatase PhoX [Cyanobacteriota bacterium]
VLPLQKTAQGSWQKQDAPQARRITGLSGYAGGGYLTATGPGAAVFNQKDKQGYDDGLGNRIIGTFANCAGGTTPWGTVLSAEENFQDQTPEAVYSDGSAANPEALPFKLTEKRLEGLGNVFGLAGNKYGWMVEIDPANPQDYGQKHTWLGRFRHEAVSVRAEAGRPLAVYSGCDRRSGHFYKFVSAEPAQNPEDKGNSRLFETGRLYGARFNPDGTGEWIALAPDTPVRPILPSQIAVVKPEEAVVYLPHSDRTQPGPEAFLTDQAVQDYGRRFQTLGDLYPGGNPQGAILIDAHLAANAVGVTPTARPEDTELLADGSVVIAFTSGWPDPEDGGCDRRVFRGPDGETPYECGWILKLQEDDNRPEALRFRWQILAAGGEPQEGGLGFSNPDNLALDGFGDLWMVTDISTGKLNQPFQRREETNSLATVGAFGNNSLWYLPLRGAGQARPFALGPMESELTGPVFSRDQQTLFLAVQHPGEARGTRRDGASQTATFPLVASNGAAFNQERTVPQGSNWPSGQVNQPPRPAVITIRRLGA